mmetsp:Transcript_23245/g.77155  ORF Transcript_23245/g.77155 Transcript_23245/m.77155 type:complete len:243 (+) Transcript_23245:541-1269(+)
MRRAKGTATRSATPPCRCCSWVAPCSARSSFRTSTRSSACSAAPRRSSSPSSRPLSFGRRASATCTTGPTRAASFASCSSASRRASRPSPSRLSSWLSSTTCTPQLRGCRWRRPRARCRSGAAASSSSAPSTAPRQAARPKARCSLARRCSWARRSGAASTGRSSARPSRAASTSTRPLGGGTSSGRPPAAAVPVGEAGRAAKLAPSLLDGRNLTERENSRASQRARGVGCMFHFQNPKRKM